jgi:hypothetical protein
MRTWALLATAATAFALFATLAAPPATAEARRAPPSTGATLARYVAAPANDRALRKDVKRWHHTLTNGCVAYASTALRHIGVEIDERGKLDGDGISRLTRGFSRHLEEHLGWQRVIDPETLAPGDLVFTTDVSCCPGYPAHVYVFHGWIDRRKQVARISDNTGHRRSRPLFPTRADLDPFAYALRAP